MQNPGDFLADQERLLRKRSSRSINSPVTASAVKLSVAPSDPRLLEKSGHSRSFFSTGNDTTTLFKIALGLLGGLSLVLGVAVVMLINALGSRSGGNILLNASTGPTYVVEQNKIMYPNGTARTFSFGKREDVAAADAALAAASLVTVETKWPSADDAVVPAEPPIPHGLPSAVMAALPASFSDFLTDGVMGSSSTQFGVANATNMTKLDGEVDIAGVGATVYTRCYTRTVFGSATATTQQPSTSSAPTMTMKPPASNPPSENWYFQLGSYFVVPNRAGVETYPWIPDGHLPTLPDNRGNWMFIWSELKNFRTIGSSPYPEDQVLKQPANSVFGGFTTLGLFNSGGMWLMSVYRQGGDNLIGFYHAEDRWTFNDQKVWKSIGVAYSKDNGITWTDGGQVLRHPQWKPGSPTWGGVGDMDVIWDPWNKRWMCYFSDGKMSMATSSDPMARPGTWYKWYRNGFNSPGLGGQHDYISNFDSVAGANPSVHFNTYLGKWIMVYHSWTGAVFITASKDTIWWDNPRQVLSSTRGYRAWYPTIIGDQGDRVIGQDARVYYADFAGDSVRDFARRMIRFVRND